MEKRLREDELKRVRQQEEHFERIKVIAMQTVCFILMLVDNIH